MSDPIPELKAWADHYLMLRVAQHAEEKSLDSQADDNRMALTGFGTPCVPSLNTAIRRVLDLLYDGIPLPKSPVTEKHIPLSERNRLICGPYAAGETLEEIADDLSISHQRVHEIIQRWC
jgi:hypothetical protein